MEDNQIDAEFGRMPTPCIVLRLDEIAEAYPEIPLVSVIRCLIKVDRKTQHVKQEDVRRGIATRLAIEGLDEIAFQHHVS